MHKLIVAAVALGSTIFPGHHHRPGCHELYTVKRTEIVAHRVYAGTKNVTLRELKHLGRIEMCQRNPHAQAFVRWYDRHQDKLWKIRRHPPAPTYGGWAIPWPIVQCESGGKNLPPNSASASGYYQVIHSTWNGYDGYDAAYLAPKSVQDRFAANLWDGGKNASQWVCAGMRGY